MICTELQDSELFRDLSTKKSSIVGTLGWSRQYLIQTLSIPFCFVLLRVVQLISVVLNAGDTAVTNSVLSCVISQLINNKIKDSSAKMGNEEGFSYDTSMSLSFRMCMANVLISACQKMPNSGKKPFAQKVLLHLIQSVGVCS